MKAFSISMSGTAMLLYQGVSPDKNPNYLLDLPVQCLESPPQTGNSKYRPWKSCPDKKTCPIAPACTKCILNYPPKSWSLESTQNSLCRSLCVLLENLHEVHPRKRAKGGGPNTLLLVILIWEPTHMKREAWVQSLLSLRQFKPAFCGRQPWKQEYSRVEEAGKLFCTSY